ncbi:hypothetical protein I3843_04G166900 [Carya illinoinensis]|nr:hypothetical protein I3843_04G166900 [Carya illinoinensis]
MALSGRARLEKAREGIERAHGKDYSRVRLLQAGCHPELAIHLRLELLEGVVTYHNGEFDRSRKALTSAHAKYFQLQVPDEALSLVMSLGFKECDAKRALRMSNQDVGSAVDFLVEEKAKRAQKREEDIRRRTEIMEQERYGMTPSKKAVDLYKLNKLVSIGFEKELAAEALQRNENDFEKALDNLTDPEANSALQWLPLFRLVLLLSKLCVNFSHNLIQTPQLVLITVSILPHQYFLMLLAAVMMLEDHQRLVKQKRGMPRWMMHWLEN